ncbi:MAG: ABC transporter ATP-binding protein [Armatimonadota bacterium]|nr:ABC transporter ATP-binding protein [Armatimonadota bacterium]MDR7444175.1 ABC transporter ATP-binding protein [Armatimonadota bacterium]MDR7570786.1 ABC transporter ATP-binding protein [Armatimonadota bacterium]MDR7614290.1 ABC transporter ATP-binding protein [Armatimonadota bacterium]
MEGLVIRNLTKVYYDPYMGQHVVAVEDISLTIGPGEFVAILGPSGCGKTTLLNMVAGFIPPTRGEILLNGRRITGPGPDRGVVFQSFALFPWKTVLENVAFGLKMRGLPRAERERIAREYIALVGLEGFEHRYPHELSGGMQQRVGVARVLANDPELMLMDEPFASVDAQTRMSLQEELARIWELRHPTILFVTHDVEEAVFLANRVVILTHRPGRVRTILEVPLPRPRRWRDLLEDSAYKALVAHVFDLLRSPQEPSRPAQKPAAASPTPHPGEPQRPWWRRLLESRLGRALLAVTLAAGGWQGWLEYQARTKMPVFLEHHLSPRGTVDLLVQLPFPPERFHILALQRFGRVSGTREHAVELRSVPPSRVREIARLYWVRGILPLSEVPQIPP